MGGLSMGAILALHLAAERPDDVHAAALFAPTLKLDGWGVPWYSVLFNLVRTRRGADFVRFSERDPYGIKDPRVRALVTAAINSGDSSKVGQLTNPGSVMLEMRWLVNIVKRELPKSPADVDRASPRTTIGRASATPPTCRGRWAASWKPASSTTAIMSSPSTVSATLSCNAPPPSRIA